VRALSPPVGRGPDAWSLSALKSRNSSCPPYPSPGISGLTPPTHALGIYLWLPCEIVQLRVMPHRCMALGVPQGVGVPRRCAGERFIHGEWLAGVNPPSRIRLFARSRPVSDRLDNSWFHPHHVAPIGEENNAPGSKLCFAGVLHFRGAGRRRRAPSARAGREGE
jgi:hypothetical protein